MMETCVVCGLDGTKTIHVAYCSKCQRPVCDACYAGHRCQK